MKGSHHQDRGGHEEYESASCAAMPKPNPAAFCIVREVKGASSFTQMKN